MFKNEIKFITDLNSAKIKNYSGFLSFSDIKKSKIHRAILKYILAEIEQQLYNDKQKLIINSIFEYNDDRIHNYLNLISENVKRTNKFKFEFISKLIQDAVIFNIHFLIAPNKTLTQFVFGNTNKKTYDEISLSLSHIYYYKYFRKIIPAYMERKNINSISRSEFLGLLKKIDDISKKSHLTDTINTAINSMANFFKGSVPNEVPIQAIYLFLQGKKLTSHSKIIQLEFLDKSVSSASVQEIKKLLNAVVLEEDIVVNNNTDNDSNLVEENSTDEFQNKAHNILELEENEKPIPNEDLISNEADIKANTIFDKNNLTENFEPVQNINDNQQELEQKTTDIDISNKEVQVSEEQTDDFSKLEKPDAREALSALIDIDELFDSTIPDSGIQDITKSALTDSNTYLDSIKETIDFKLEGSTLEKTLINENTIDEDEINLAQFQSVYEADMELKDSIRQKEDLFVEEKIIEQTEEKIKEVEEYIHDSKIKETVIKENEQEITENVTENDFNIENNKKDITLSENNDEEMTEVFSDLAYLDKEEPKDEPEQKEITEENIELKNEKESKFEIQSENEDILTNDNDDEILTKTDIVAETKVSTAKVSATTASFKEMISNEDMSQTIEIIFDYDMEDYQRILNEISECKTEQDAIRIVDNYCVQNYINTTYSEVEKFKTLISNYFLQR